MSTYIEGLIEALGDEFAGSPAVTFSPAIPTTFTPPQIVVTPGDPFLVPKDFLTIEERWSVLVVVSMANRQAGVDTMRQSSLRVFRAANSVGGIWERASGPQVPAEDDNRKIVLSVNDIRFMYPRAEQVPATPEP